MGNAIFKSGQCRKDEIYSKFCGWLTEGGWINKSSNPYIPGQPFVASKDNDVWYSKGKSGDLDLLLCTVPTPADLLSAKNLETSLYAVMSFSFQTGYTPNETIGTNGVFKRANAWTNIPLWTTSNALTLQAPGNDTPIFYNYYCDANRLIFILRISQGYGANAKFVYLGIPDEGDLFTETEGSRDMVFATNSYANGSQAAPIYVCDTPKGVGSGAAYGLSSYYLLPPKDPTLKGQRFLVPYAYGNASERWRGKLSDCYSVYNENVVDGMELFEKLPDGTTAKYETVITGQYANNWTSFYNYAMAYRVE